MRLGISYNIPHSCADEWAANYQKLGLGAVVFPLNWQAEDSKINSYVQACHDHDLVIAEVGAWCNVMTADKSEKAKNIDYCQRQLQLAEDIGARCCVNISGAAGLQWDGGYKDNYSQEFRQQVVETICTIIDKVNPKKSCYTLEPMPWMTPDSPQDYLDIINKVDRQGFAVHLDIVNMINTPQKYFFNRDFINECFKLLGRYICSCHLKDVKLQSYLTFNLKEVTCGAGELDISYYLAAAEDCQAEMPVIIEHLSSYEEYLAAINYVKLL